MEREDNYTHGGAPPGRPSLTQKEFMIKEKRLKEKRSAKALERLAEVSQTHAAGQAAPDEVLDAEPLLRRSGRTPKRKIIQNIGLLPHTKSASKKSASRRQPSVLKDYRNNEIVNMMAQLGVGSQSSRSLRFSSRGSRGSRSRGSRSRASRLPEVAKEPFKLAPSTFRFAPIPEDKEVPEDKEGSMGPNKGGRRTRRHGRKTLRRRKNKRSTRKN
jgi:hypothetical protein